MQFPTRRTQIAFRAMVAGIALFLGGLTVAFANQGRRHAGITAAAAGFVGATTAYVVSRWD